MAEAWRSVNAVSWHHLLKSRRLKPDVGHMSPAVRHALASFQVLGPPEDGNDGQSMRSHAVSGLPALPSYPFPSEAGHCTCVLCSHTGNPGEGVRRIPFRFQCLGRPPAMANILPEGILKLRLLIKDILDFLYVHILRSSSTIPGFLPSLDWLEMSPHRSASCSPPGQQCPPEDLLIPAPILV